MKCHQCQRENPADAVFCDECGARLEAVCPDCGERNRAGAKFCRRCGSALGESAVAASTPASSQGPPPGPGAERRQLTVMFCDLVGSTRLSAELDPEDLRGVVRAYQETCAEVIARFEGYIAQYLGDGLLVYFGYPLAHEDDAQRAVGAALGIREAMARLNTRLERDKRVRLAVRLGIHTGLTVVGEMGASPRQEPLALGETPNIAARLQELAEADSVMVSATTHRLIRARFACRELGVRALKGGSFVHAYQVTGERQDQGRLDETADPLVPLVAREQELALLLERWEHVTEGLGQVVVLTGEPGIGKSRLLAELRKRAADTPHGRLEARCSPYYRHTPLYPVVELLQGVAQWAREDGADDRLGKLEAVLARHSMPLPEVVPLMASFLSLPLPDRYLPVTSLSPERQKQKTLEAVLGLLLAMAAQEPLVLIVEDLHWVDPSTLEFLTLLLDQAPSARIFTLLTARPEFHSPWTPRSHITQLTLNRLTRKQTDLMVERVEGGKSLPVEIRRQIVDKTDGIPLFVEELTKSVLESGLVRHEGDRYEPAGLPPSLAIPATLQDSLMARLDRLGAAKEVAQLGAVLGRAFPYELLRAVSPVDEAALANGLGRLIEAELLHQRGLPPKPTYVFKHALIQEAAYQSLLKATRQEYHRRIAEVVSDQFPDVAETQPELLAHHYTEAGIGAEAVPYWYRAGQRAIERAANVEAIGHLSRGLDALERLPDDAERARLELDLQIALGPALMTTKGYGAPEVARAYARARELCRRVGEAPQLFAALRGLWEYYWLRATDVRTVLELARELYDVAERAGDSALRVVAHDVMGDTSLCLGEFRAARSHMEQGIALYDPRRHSTLAFRYGGYDPGMACRCLGGHALWYLGYPDQALGLSREGLALARELSHPPSLAFALGHAGILHQLRREAPLTLERAEESMTLSTKEGFALWPAFAAILKGWALVQQAQGSEGIAMMRQGLDGYRVAGGELERPLWLAMLADAYQAVGRPEEGLATLDEALAGVRETGVRFTEAELHRLKGDLLLAQAGSSVSQAEGCFRQALDIAVSQRAKSLELRAATSLSRLLRSQGHREEARRTLAGVHRWFTEGFATGDLQDARTLLEELS